MGMSAREACLHADISQQTYYKVIKANPELGKHLESLRDNPLKMARGIVYERLKRGKDVETAKWYLERKAKSEFSTRTESEENRNVTVNIINFDGNTNPSQLRPEDTPLPVGDSSEPEPVQVIDYSPEGGEDGVGDQQAEH